MAAVFRNERRFIRPPPNGSPPFALARSVGDGDVDADTVA
jgi:hypothetical protein